MSIKTHSFFSEQTNKHSMSVYSFLVSKQRGVENGKKKVAVDSELFLVRNARGCQCQQGVGSLRSGKGCSFERSRCFLVSIRSTRDE